jgi:pyruvate/2-oxoglutarate/acetoin dehydrogenase E1 component
MRVCEALNRALFGLLRDDPDVLVLGEDVRDPYGGAFKVTAGLSSAFPGRVLGTPISEAGIVGLGTGLALSGRRPVVEIMFGDFVTLAADQLVNQAAKFRTMYGEAVSVPLVVRAPMGGRRGYGPTHSQTLEKLFFGVPGLEVVAATHVCDPGALLRGTVLGTACPVLFVENKLLYLEEVLDAGTLRERHGLELTLAGAAPGTAVLAHPGRPDVTLVAYGGMVPLALEAAGTLLREEGLVCELVVPQRICPLDPGPILGSAARTRRVVVVEEGVCAWGWGAEVLALLAALELESPARRVGATLEAIPARRDCEARVLPQVDDIVAAAVRTVDEDFL